MSFKIDLTCSFCTKIFKSPISLPCGDTICEQHLKEDTYCKCNSIKCKTCHKDFDLDDLNQLIKPNTIVQKLIEHERYLSDIEKSIKNSLEESLSHLFELNKKMQQSKDCFLTDSKNHFQKMIHKIELQRIELRNQIDDISYSMIDEIKVIEQSYARNMDYFQVDTFDLEEEKKKLNETFRNVNLSLESIKGLKSKQDMEISSITSKIQKISQLKAHLVKSNSFRPNKSFNLDSFGILDLTKMVSISTTPMKYEYVSEIEIRDHHSYSRLVNFS
jgi:hypothetical protein